jgi:phage gpG-like protein
MFSVELETSAATKTLDDLASLMADLSPVMEGIGEMLTASTRDRLVQGVSPDGTPFAPRSPATLDAYERSPDGYGPVPLWRSGHMRSETLHASYGPNWIRFGSSAEYSGVVQFGAGQGAFGAIFTKDKRGRDHSHLIPWGDIPARPFIGLSQVDQAGIQDIVVEFLETIGA